MTKNKKRVYNVKSYNQKGGITAGQVVTDATFKVKKQKKTKFSFPKNHKPYIDKYFLRAKEILKKEELNPNVKCQVFLRSEGNVYGINEAIACFKKYLPKKSKVKVKALSEGSEYSSTETIMTIDGNIQDIIDLETMYLGIISRETTLKNGGEDINLKDITLRIEQIKELIGDRSFAYFGARHWGYEKDRDISKAAFDGGASACSTDIGANYIGKEGVGTIPHILEAIYHWKYGVSRAVIESTKVFDRIIDPKIPRIALVDYANREIDDATRTAAGLKGALYGIRIDTCGENIMQGLEGIDERGVTINGAQLVRQGLKRASFPDVKIMLSSGFGKIEKVKSFIEAEKRLGVRLFDSLGGGLFESRTATMDVVRIENQIIGKVGRKEKPNSRLKRMI